MNNNNNVSFRGWHQVAATMLMQAAASGSVFISFSVLARAYGEAYQPDRAVLMLAITAVVLGNGLLGPFVGKAMQKITLKTLMMFSVVMLGLGFVLVSQTQAMWQVLVIYLLFMSFATTLGGPIAGAALLSRWFNRRRGLAMSLSAAGAAIGGLLAPPLLQNLIELVGWRIAVGSYGAGLMLLILPILWWVIIERPDDIGQTPDGDGSQSGISSQHQSTLSWSFFLQNKNFWLVSITLGILFSSSMGVASNLIQFVAERGISAQQGAYLLSIYSTFNFVGKMLSGSLADKYSPRIILGLIILVFSSAIAGYAHARQYDILIVLSMLFGVSQGAIVPLWSVLVAKLYGPEHVGNTMGMMSTVLMPFNFIAAPLFGFAFDRTASYYPAFLGCLTMLLVAFILQFFIHEDKALLADGGVSKSS